jgi:Ca-activated chloride channel family protein
MFHFSHPWLLLLLLLIPPLLWWWLTRRRAAIVYPATGLLARLPAGRSRLALWGGIVGRALALVLLAVAAAGPRWPDQRTRITTEGIAILMVVDVSDSMSTTDFYWNGVKISRLEAVKRAFRLFIEGGDGPGGVRLPGRPTDLIGLVVFGTHPDTASPLTLSRSALLRVMDDLKPRTGVESRTNLCDAIALGLYRARAAGTQRRILVLLTDGINQPDSPASQWTIDDAASNARKQDIPIYTIDANGTGDVADADPLSLKLRQDAAADLALLAHETGGQYFRADNATGLAEAYRGIDAIERSKIEGFQYRRYHEGYAAFALTAFGLLVALRLLEMTVWRRVP